MDSLLDEESKSVSFWFNKCRGIAIPSYFPVGPIPGTFTMAEKSYFSICTCADVDIKQLDPKDAPFTLLGDIIKCLDTTKQYKDARLGDVVWKLKDGYTLPSDKNCVPVLFCLDFITMKQQKKVPRSLNEFIESFLNITGGYKYILMNYMEKKKYINHGISIRCAYSILSDYKMNDERVNKIMKWLRKPMVFPVRSLHKPQELINIQLADFNDLISSDPTVVDKLDKPVMI